MKARVIPVVVTTLGIIPETTAENIAKLGTGRRDIRAMQKAVILHTKRMVRKTLGKN